MSPHTPVAMTMGNTQYIDETTLYPDVSTGKPYSKWGEVYQLTLTDFFISPFLLCLIFMTIGVVAKIIKIAAAPSVECEKLRWLSFWPDST